MGAHPHIQIPGGANASIRRERVSAHDEKLNSLHIYYNVYGNSGQTPNFFHFRNSVSVPELPRG